MMDVLERPARLSCPCTGPCFFLAQYNATLVPVYSTFLMVPCTKTASLFDRQLRFVTSMLSTYYDGPSRTQPSGILVERNLAWNRHGLNAVQVPCKMAAGWLSRILSNSFRILAMHHSEGSESTTYKPIALQYLSLPRVSVLSHPKRVDPRRSTPGTDLLWPQNAILQSTAQPRWSCSGMSDTISTDCMR
ncbi:hypothetical protein BD414DRAFT_96182 [Trametes punicea]|nr:hypothetical protein BD414DRAFT_96182 [Trametes punicea]